MPLDSPCPSPEMLRRSIDPDDPMTPPERQRIETHVDGCQVGCKQALDALLRGVTLASGSEATHPTPAPGAPASERPPPCIPGYEILGELGRGGMAVVYKARHVGLNRLVAIKMILAGAHATAQELARFRTEAEAVAALKHPNVVQIYEIGAHDGCPYFSLEFVEGGTLSQHFDRVPQPPCKAADLVETLARAVHFAHQQGVIHRDLKPANVLLAADGTPKIADFGLAKRLESGVDHTRTGQIVGTPNYMAPEQAAATPALVGKPADIYALGAILYTMLTGRPPFRGDTPWRVLVQVQWTEPVPPRRLSPNTPADLETICLKCLRKEPRSRYSSAEALADDLSRFLDDRPIQARRVGGAERAVKWVRRNPVLTGVLAIAVLASVGAAGGWLWAVQDRAARQIESNRLAAARLSAAQDKADIAINKARADERQAALVESAADDKGQEEPETPETAKQVVGLLRQAEAALDEAERALAEVLGIEAARAQTGERRGSVQAKRKRAEKIAALLSDLDRARGARAGSSANGPGKNASAKFYTAAFSAYGLDLARPERETAAEIRNTRPGIRLALILALDDWASYVRGLDAAQADRLSRIAGGADDDDWRRRYRAAIGDLTALKRLAQEAPRLHLPAVSVVQLGRDLYTRDARSDAAILLRAARRQHPGDFWVYFDLNNCLFDPDHVDPATLEEAEGCVCTAVALRPDSAIAQSNMGNALRAHGDQAGAAECYRKAIVLDPGFALAVNNLGIVLADVGDQAGAADCYRKAIEIDPKYASPHECLGNLLFRQGEWAGAAECYKKAIELSPKAATAHCGFGSALYNQGDLVGAAVRYKRAIELDDRLAIAHYCLGNVVRDQGDLAGAAKCFRKSIDLNPKYVEAHINFGSLLQTQGDFAGAAAYARKAIELDPKFVYAHNNLGNALAKQGDLAGAAECYRKAIDLDPKYARGHYNLGTALRDRGDSASAIESFRKAVELDPKYVAAQNDLGLILLDQGDLTGAAVCYKKAVELDPKYPQARYGLGAVLLDQGQFAEARTNFRRCLDLLAADAPLRAGASDKLQRCERLLSLEAKLPAVLKGEQQPADDAERIGLAEVCEYQHRYVAAVRFSRDAFAHDAKLADDMQVGNRYAAALDAARAGCGQGEDVKDLDDKALAGCRKQALTWLQADIVFWRNRLKSAAPEDRQATKQQLSRWQTDPALAGVRDTAEVAKLPTDEQEVWRKLWMEVQSVVDKAGE
jgi:tetratricopeptide (TPR) repeat protein/tRNA A-37 threonylcarbamoyl transferase component Bud32